MGTSPSRPSPRAPVPVGPRLQAVLEIAYRARRPVLLEGPTGIGKSQVVQQVAERLGIRHEVLDLSLLEPSDLVGLPVIADDRTSYARPRFLPSDGAGILLLEELNRAERYVQQPALQLLSARRLHDYVLPDGWCVMAAVNPEDGEYQVTPLDAALRARFLNLAVRADRAEWLRWAEQNGVHPAVLKLARNHDQILADVPPRSWTYVSDLLRSLTVPEMWDDTLVRSVLGGYLPQAWVTLLLAEKASWADPDGLDAYRLVREYHEDPALQATLREWASNGRTDALTRAADRVFGLVAGPELGRLVASEQFSLKAFETLLTHLPGDHRERLQEAYGGNPLGIALIGLDLPRILDLDDSEAAKLIPRWAASPLLRHRVRSAITAVSVHLDDGLRAAQVRRSMPARKTLGRLLRMVGPGLDRSLRDVLRRHDIQPMDR